MKLLRAKGVLSDLVRQPQASSASGGAHTRNVENGSRFLQTAVDWGLLKAAYVGIMSGTVYEGQISTVYKKPKPW